MCPWAAAECVLKALLDTLSLCDADSKQGAQVLRSLLVKEDKLQSFLGFGSMVPHPDFPSLMTNFLSQLLGVWLAKSPSIPSGNHLCSGELPG